MARRALAGPCQPCQDAVWACRGSSRRVSGAGPFWMSGAMAPFALRTCTDDGRGILHLGQVATEPAVVSKRVQLETCPHRASSGAAAPNCFCAPGCLPFARHHRRAYSSNERRDHLKQRLEKKFPLTRRSLSGRAGGPGSLFRRRPTSLATSPHGKQEKILRPTLSSSALLKNSKCQLQCSFSPSRRSRRRSGSLSALYPIQSSTESRAGLDSCFGRRRPYR